MTGWKIKGWSTVADNSDNSNLEYAVGTSYSVTNANPGDSITLYAHWMPLYSIQYDGNGASNTNGMGTTNSTTGVKSVRQVNVGEGDQVTLLPSNFKRTGYSFIGWSTSSTATLTSGDKIYGPMETIDAPAYPSNSTIVTMYAVWLKAAEDSNHNPIYLQDFSSTDCNNLTATSFDSATGIITPGGVVALTDKRDDEVYAIAKLADGKCWMIENLRLEHEGTVGQNKNNSSVTNESLSEGYSTNIGTGNDNYGSFIGLAEAEGSDKFGATTSNSF